MKFSVLRLVGVFVALALPSHAQNSTIPQIQGAGAQSPVVDQEVTVEGIVTGDFQGEGRLSGFYLQDAVGDDDPQTSDGLFVYQSPRSQFARLDLHVGERVRVAGRVEEYKGQTQIGRLSEITVLGREKAPKPTEVDLETAGDLERFEGMLVRFSQPLVVTGQHELERFGTLVLAPRRLFVGTNLKPIGEVTPDTTLTLRLDDGSSAQSPNPTPYLSAERTRRTGSRVLGLTGIVGFDFETYRLHPTQPPVWEDNARPTSPPSVGGDLKVAGANVLNYWTTFKNAQNPKARGAEGPTQFERQSQKIVAMLKGLDADVVALQELENNGSRAVGELVRRLNLAYGAPTYAFVPDPTAGIGPDAIKVAMIYKPARLERVGASQAATDAIYDRFPLGQTFRDKKSGGVFSVVSVHFKSKGSAPESGDVDKGEGAWNEKRTAQAQALLKFITNLQSLSKDADVITIGDFNAYAEETPNRTLRAGGLKHLNLRLAPEKRFSYSFDGRFGSLDHAFVTPSLDSQVVGVGEWHINADEPFFLTYNRISPSNFAPTPFRASDHDPFLVGLKLKRDVTAVAPKPVVKPKPATKPAAKPKPRPAARRR